MSVVPKTLHRAMSGITHDTNHGHQLPIGFYIGIISIMKDYITVSRVPVLILLTNIPK